MNYQTLVVKDPIRNSGRHVRNSVGLTFSPGTYRGGDLVLVSRGGKRYPIEIFTCQFHDDGSCRWAAADYAAPAGTYAVQPTTERNAFKWNRRVQLVAGQWDIIPVGFTECGVDTLTQTGLVREFRRRFRRPDGMWLWVTMKGWTDSVIGDYSIDYGWSDEGSEDFYVHRGKIQVLFRGLIATVEDAAERVDAISSNTEGTVVTINPREWSDQEANVFEGQFVFQVQNPTTQEIKDTRGALQTFPECVKGFALSQDWRAAPYLSPIGTLNCSGEAGADAKAVELYQGLQGKGRWYGSPTGLAAYPGRVGGQSDFGVHNETALLAACSGSASLAEIQRRICRQEACRPVHFRDEDALPFVAKDYPKVWLWDGRPHNHSPDRLGKPQQNNWAGQTKEGHVGRDRQHHFVNEPVQVALLTGDRWLLRWADIEVERMLASFPAGSFPPSKTLEEVVPPRQMRSFQSAAMLYWLTGNQELVDRFKKRAELNIVDHYETNREPKIHTYHGERPNRWTPWENSEWLRSLYIFMQVVDLSDEFTEIFDIYLQEFLNEGVSQRDGTWEVAWWVDTATGESNWSESLVEWAWPVLQIGGHETLNDLELSNRIPNHWKI